MTTILSEAAGILAEILMNPPRDVLDDQVATQLVMEASSFYKHQIGAAGHLLSGGFFEVEPPAQEFLVNVDGFNRPLYVQRRLNTVDDRWERVTVVDIAALEDEADLGKLAVTFFGNPPMMRLSWDPSTLTPSSLRVWHDANSVEPTTLDQDLDVPLNILKYMIARRAVLLALPRLAMKVPTIWTPDVVKAFAQTNAGSLMQYEEEFNLWRFDRGDEGWSQMEGFDEPYGVRRRRRFF